MNHVTMHKLSREKNRIAVQSFGRFLSRMVMPNIGAFIAWGLLTACFNENGWIPNENLANMINPMITYMLPLLIGYTGGKMLADTRGGVVGTVATMGVVAGTDIPMFLGAMIAGPLGGLCIKRLDAYLKNKVPMGFEMLVHNFSAGIIGSLLAIIGYLIVGPIVEVLSLTLEQAVYWLVNRNLLFLASAVIEPGKILFLNNAINHGVLGNLGIQQAKEIGKSVFFLLETNPGPGLGILLASYWHAKKSVRETVPGAMIIHFLGGIHEIYFPYVLSNPLLFLAVIGGGMSGVLVMNLLSIGLVATPSPGSIFAVLAMTPKSDMIGVLLAVTVSTAVTFVIARVLMLSMFRPKSEVAVKEAEEIVYEVPSSQRSFSDTLNFEVLSFEEWANGKTLKKMIFACDTGMGSSAMGAALISKMITDENISIVIENASIDDIPADADIVITFESLKARAVKASPRAYHIGLTDFLYKPQYETFIKRIKPYCINEEGTIAMSTPKEILLKSNILLNQASVSKEEAIRFAGELLLKSGYVEAEYIEGMLAREAKFTTFIGNGVAIPHGENEVKDKIIASGIVVIQYPNGVDFGDGNIVKLVIGIAGKGNEHIQLLSNIAEAIEDEVLLAQMTTTDQPEFMYKLLA